MKKILLILLCLPIVGFGQQTYVPDNWFESYLEYNGMGNGILNDSSVFTSAIDTVTSLYLYNLNISDLTGIEEFTSLTELSCHSNQLTTLDVSGATALTHLNCYTNQLTTLNVSQNTALTSLFCYNNQLTTLDVSQNIALTYLGCSYNQLTGLDVSANTALERLWCNNNQLTSLDVSNNINLWELNCYNNQLTTLDVRNGLNSAFSWFDCTGNPNLTCISVDNPVWSTTNWTVAFNHIDPQHYFSNNCSGTSVEEHSTNQKLLRIIDVLGRETKETNQPLFYIYDDGTVEKKLTIE